MQFCIRDASQPSSVVSRSAARGKETVTIEGARGHHNKNAKGCDAEREMLEKSA
jgi:hypothetical protein